MIQFDESEGRKGSIRKAYEGWEEEGKQRRLVRALAQVRLRHRRESHVGTSYRGIAQLYMSKA